MKNDKVIDPNKAKSQLNSVCSKSKSGAAGGSGKGRLKIQKGRSQSARKSNKTP